MAVHLSSLQQFTFELFLTPRDRDYFTAVTLFSSLRARQGGAMTELDSWYPTDRAGDRLRIRDQLGQLGAVCFHHKNTIETIAGNILVIRGKAAKQAPGLDVRQPGHFAAVHGNGPPIGRDIAMSLGNTYAH